MDAPRGSGSYLRLTTHPKVLSLTLDLKVTYSKHIHNISVYAHNISVNAQKHSPQQDGVNRRRHSWLPTRQSRDRLWSMPNTHTSHTRAPTAPRLTIQTKYITSITPQTYNILQHSKAKKHYL